MIKNYVIIQVIKEFDCSTNYNTQKNFTSKLVKEMQKSLSLNRISSNTLFFMKIDKEIEKCLTLILVYRKTSGVSKMNPYTFELPNKVDNQKRINGSSTLKTSSSLGKLQHKMKKITVKSVCKILLSSA